MNVVDFEEYKKKKALRDFYRAISQTPTEEDVYFLYWCDSPESSAEFLETLEDK